MKSFYIILSLLLPSIAISVPAINAYAATEQRLDDPIPAPIQKGSIRLRLKQIADGLTAPNWGISIPGATEHLYVSDQDFKLWRINLANNTKEIFLTMSFTPPLPLGVSGDERGFLGFAFHPQYVENGLWYTYTSQLAGDGSSDFSTMPAGTPPNHRSVITEMRSISPSLNDFPTRIEPGRELLAVAQPQSNHNGGALNFGPDNMLYIAFGDGGAADDQGIGHGTGGNGQDPTNPLGSLLRIDPTGNNSANGKYGIPNDNPFVGSGTAIAETYAYGFRNPFRFSFDSKTGALVLADVGQNDIEEVNLVQSGGNYGWGLKEGSFRFEPNGDDPGFVTDGAVAGNFIDPVVQYDHDEGFAIIGGFVYRGNAIPALQGQYLFGDVIGTGRGDGRLFYSDGSQILELDLTERDHPGFRILGFGQDGDGELYVLGNTTGTPFGTTGVVYKLIPNAGFDSTSVEIPAVNVTFDNGDTAIYRARLQFVPGSQPQRFELAHAEELAERFRDDTTTFDQTTGKLNLPFTDVVDANGKVFTYAVELQQVPDLPVLTFELKQSALVK